MNPLYLLVLYTLRAEARKGEKEQSPPFRVPRIVEQLSGIIEVSENLQRLRVELPVTDKVMAEPIDICDHQHYTQSTKQVHDLG